MFFLTKRNSILLIFCFLLLLSCQSPKEKQFTESIPVSLNEETATIFARQIERSLYNDDPTFFNQAFDQTFIKKAISDNSIVSSSLDTEFGKEYFKNNISVGDFVLGAIRKGGDFKFIKYYKDGETHHIIFRLYSDYGITIDDYELHICDNEIRIKDGFNYNLGVSLIQKIKYSILYNTLQKTDPNGNTSIIAKADKLISEEKYKEAADLLQKNQELIKEYPHYHQLLLQSSFLAAPKQFIPFIEKLNLDHRTLLIHQLLYYTNSGNIQASQKIIDELINITGDDPIYLFLYGRANLISKKYNDALTCFKELENALPPLWDIWTSSLECHYKLKQSDEFINTLLMGEKNYSMTPEEMIQITQENYPQMLGTVKKHFNK